MDNIAHDVKNNGSAKLEPAEIKQSLDDVASYDKLSISSVERLEQMLKETEDELFRLQPEIESLESALDKLKVLKQTKQKLITLKLSIKSILSNFSNVKYEAENLSLIPEKVKHPSADKTLNNFTENLSQFQYTKSKRYASRPTSPQRMTRPGAVSSGTFYPDRAFAGADEVLRQKDSTNYELFRAIVFSGGRASTQEIKQYLLDHDVRLPLSGEGFEEVPLTDISARINYLIRKGLVAPDGRGYFRALTGWED